MMEPKKKQVTGIILAGGMSTRMGVDKGLVKLKGYSLMEIMIHHLSNICDPILISSNSGVYDDYGFMIVKDQYQDIGPMGGVHAALCQSKTKLNLVVSVDLPFINEALLRFLVQEAEGYDAAVPWAGAEKFEPLCACYNKSVLPVIERFINQGNFKLPDLFKEIALNAISIKEDHSFFHPHLFLNVNSMEELAKAEKYFIADFQGR